MENNCLKNGYHFMVDYSQPVLEIARENHFKMINDSINLFSISQEPTEGQFSLYAELFQQDEGQDVFKMIEEAGYCPANLKELLACDAAYPELKQDFCVVALGSVIYNCRCRNCRIVPFIGCVNGLPGLSVTEILSDWYPNYRFLGIRKTS